MMHRLPVFILLFRKMHGLPVSALIVQKDAWTRCLYTLVVQNDALLAVSVLIVQNDALLAVSALIVQNDALLPVSALVCSCCSELCMHKCTSSFCPYCSEGCMCSQSLLLLFRMMHYSQFLSLLFTAMHVRTFQFRLLLFRATSLHAHIYSPVSALIVQKDAWAPSLCSCCSEQCIAYTYFQFMPLLFRRMHELSVSALVVKRYAYTYFQFMSLLFRRMHGLPVSTLAVQNDALLPVSALIVQNDALLPVSALIVQSYAYTYFQFLLLLFRTMHVRTSSFCSCCSEDTLLSVSALIVQSYACTYFQFLLLLFRTVHAHMYVQFSFCPYGSDGCIGWAPIQSPLMLFRRMHGLPVSTLVVHNDALLPVSALIVRSYA
jgi:hypothetical protein